MTFICSIFIEEGQRVAMGGDKKTITELEGTVGSSPTNDRKRALTTSSPSILTTASQSGDFASDNGRQVAEILLLAHPDANVSHAQKTRWRSAPSLLWKRRADGRS